MLTVNMHEAKTQLSKLVEAALGGEEVVIAKAGKPAVRLVRVEVEEQAERPRKELFGLLRGKVWAAPNAWDPMTDEELDDLFDGPLFPDEKADGGER